MMGSFAKEIKMKLCVPKLELSRVRSPPIQWPSTMTNCSVLSVISIRACRTPHSATYILSCRRERCPQSKCNRHSFIISKCFFEEIFSECFKCYLSTPISSTHIVHYMKLKKNDKKPYCSMLISCIQLKGVTSNKKLLTTLA